MAFLSLQTKPYTAKAKPYIQPVVPYIEKAKPYAPSLAVAAAVLAAIPVCLTVFFLAMITSPVSRVTLFFLISLTARVRCCNTYT